MSRLVAEVRLLSNGYVRKGGKTNRKQQRNRMLEFAAFCESEGARYIAQIGARHVVRYWRSEPVRSLSDRTRTAHYYALVKLWELAGKASRPPEPFSKQNLINEPQVPESSSTKHQRSFNNA
jgi:hypothetical protein